MKLSRVLHHHNRHGGLCHNSPRLHSVIRSVCISFGDRGGWWYRIHPSDIGRAILNALSVDPYDVYKDYPAPQGSDGNSFIRGDIRFRMTLLQQLLMLVLFIILMLL